MSDNGISALSFIGVDWGTSSFRLWAMEGDTVVATSRSNEGMLHCSGSGFAPVLDRHLAEIGARDDVPVLICGMAGAKQGWIEAAYVDAPASLLDLQNHAVKVPASNRDIRILPGLAQPFAGAPNVMRGEETQLLGSVDSSFTGLVCMPGTHCKWVSVENGRVVHFSTFMTGELFAVIAKHSILAFAVEPDSVVGPDNGDFHNGLAAVREDGSALLASLFSVRAGQLLGMEKRAQGAGHLSGLLIGAEIAAAKLAYGTPGEILLIGSGALAPLYEAALIDAGYSVKTRDAEEAVRKGLTKAAAGIWLETA